MSIQNVRGHSLLGGVHDQFDAKQCWGAADPDYSTATAAAADKILSILDSCCVHEIFGHFFDFFDFWSSFKIRSTPRGIPRTIPHVSLFRADPHQLNPSSVYTSVSSGFCSSCTSAHPKAEKTEEQQHKARHAHTVFACTALAAL